jgi:parallel beta-helix repeat protein
MNLKIKQLNKLFTIAFLTLFILVLPTDQSSAIFNEITETISEKNETILSPKFLPPLTDSPVGITNDGEFTTYASNPGATGLVDDPFIIENYYIDASSTNYGISINETVLHFEIRNCIILGGNQGIWLHKIEAKTGTLYNNTIVNATIGCLFTDAMNITTSFNDVSGSIHGIYLYNNAFYHDVFNNTVSDCDIGINSMDSFGSNIYNNTVTACDQGIVIDTNSDAWVVQNIISGCSTNGIYDLQSVSSHIISNYLSDNYVGITINIAVEHEFIGNIIRDSIMFGLYTQTIENIDFQHNRFYRDGLYFAENNYTRLATHNFDNTNNYVNDELAILEVSKNGLHFTDPIGQLMLYNCSNVDIENIVISDVYTGIILQDCSYLRLFQCSFADAGAGISTDGCEDVEIDHCSFERNAYGAYVYQSENVNINNSTLTDNVEGVHFFHSDLGVIQKNVFFNNTDFGVFLETSDFNIVFQNSFIDNGAGAQAGDWYGTGNFWYSLLFKKGNYWSDYLGTGDYLIYSEFSDIFDLYPLNDPVVIIHEFGQVGLIFSIISLVTLISLGIIHNKRK